MSSNKQDERIAKMTFASVYPHYLEKIEKKGRTREELLQVIEWLTGFNEKKLKEKGVRRKKVSELFFLTGPLACSKLRPCHAPHDLSKMA